ncbi:hypothetical protein Tco_0921196, partial [Tanacetum coccineum]
QMIIYAIPLADDMIVDTGQDPISPGAHIFGELWMRRMETESDNIEISSSSSNGKEDNAVDSKSWM